MKFQSGKPGKDLFNRSARNDNRIHQCGFNPASRARTSSTLARTSQGPHIGWFQSGKPGKDLFNRDSAILNELRAIVSIRQAGQGPLQRHWSERH